MDAESEDGVGSIGACLGSAGTAIKIIVNIFFFFAFPSSVNDHSLLLLISPQFPAEISRVMHCCAYERGGTTSSLYVSGPHSPAIGA
jgi:hypothetical protein